jgi:hypothetical protein
VSQLKSRAKISINAFQCEFAKKNILNSQQPMKRFLVKIKKFSGNTLLFRFFFKSLTRLLVTETSL